MRAVLRTVSSQLRKVNRINMEPNLTFLDIVIRYIIMMIVMILAGVFQSITLIILGVAVFMTAISAYCPIYQALGRKSTHTE